MIWLGIFGRFGTQLEIRTVRESGGEMGHHEREMRKLGEKRGHGIRNEKLEDVIGHADENVNQIVEEQ